MLKASPPLTYKQAAALCRVSLFTVKSWLKPPSSKSHSEPPDMAVELLYLKLKLDLPPELTATAEDTP
jgi:hypothetical protein